MNYTPKTFKMDQKVAKQLEKTAEREQRTQTVIVERALQDYFDRNKASDAADAAKETTQPAQA